MFVDSPVNKGKGGAVRLGMLVAKGEKILMMDADLATDLSSFEPCNRQVIPIYSLIVRQNKEERPRNHNWLP